MSKKKSKYILQIFALLPIFIVLAIVPLIVYNDFNPNVRSSAIFYDSPFDFFSAAKSKFIVLLGPLALLCSYFSSDKFKKDLVCLSKDPVFWAFGTYFVFVVLSAAFSEYRDVAFHGVTGRNEGMFVYLSYFCLWLAVVLQVRGELQVKFIMYSMYFFISIAAVIGISQVLGRDILTSETMRPFIMSKEQYALSSVIVYKMQSNLVPLTFSNPNYVGSYMGMMFVVCFSLFIISDTVKGRVLHGVFAALCCFLLVLSLSKGGITAAFSGTILALIVLYKKAIIHWKSIIVLFTSVLITLVATNCVLSKSFSFGLDSVLNRLSPEMMVSESTLSKPIQNGLAQNVSSGALDAESGVSSYNKGDMTLSVRDNVFTIVKAASEESINFRINDGSLVYYDESMNETAIKEGEQSFDINKPNFPKLTVNVKMPVLSVFFYDDYQTVNLLTENDRFYFSTYDGIIIEAAEIEKLTAGQYIDDFDFNGNKISVTTTNGSIFNIEYDGEKVKFTSDIGEPIDYVLLQNETTYFLTSPGYEGYIVYAQDNNIALAAFNPVNFVYEDGRIRLLTETGKRLDSSKAPVFPLFKGKETMFTNRGYIWGRSIPLLKDTIFLGHGSDTFVFYFPHYEFKEKQMLSNLQYSIIDKPHMLYLQIAINTGVLSLIAFLTTFALFYLKSVKLLLHNALENKWFQYSVCFAGGTLAYLVAGLVNDSVVYVAPTFFTVFAMGYAGVRNYREEIMKE